MVVVATDWKLKDQTVSGCGTTGLVIGLWLKLIVMLPFIAGAPSIWFA